MGKYTHNTYLNPETGAETPNNPQAVPMTYIDPYGAQKVGYSIGNKMYKDESGTERIDVGSVVSNRDGTRSWVMTPSGGVDYRTYTAGQTGQAGAYLQNAQKAGLAAVDQRNQATLAAMEQQRPQIQQAYDHLAQQNYRGYMQTGTALANTLASQGLYNSGYSDNAKIAQAVSYRETQNANERARLQALGQLENQIAQTRLNGAAERNYLEAQYAQMLSDQANLDRSHLYQLERDAAEDRRYEAEFAAAQERLQWEQKQAEAAAEKEDARRAVEAAYDAAAIGDFSKLEQLGINTANARRLYELELQKAYKAVLDTNAIEQTQQKVMLEGDALLKIYGGTNTGRAEMLAYLNSPNAKNMYINLLGEQGYDELLTYVLERSSERNAASAAKLYEAAIARAEDLLPLGADGRRVATPQAKARLVAELAASGLRDDDLAEIILRYGLQEEWRKRSGQGANR